MFWSKISPEVYVEGNDYMIPFVKGSEGAVDMFGSPDYYSELTFELSVKKGWLGINPFWRRPFLFDEFAVFICNDWATWRGQEFGFRFPMHLPENWCTVYAQHPYGWRLWFDLPIRVKDIEEPHFYAIEVKRSKGFVKASFKIDGKTKFWYGGRNFDRPFLPVLCAHTRYDVDYGFTMRLKSIECL